MCLCIILFVISRFDEKYVFFAWTSCDIISGLNCLKYRYAVYASHDRYPLSCSTCHDTCLMVSRVVIAAKYFWGQLLRLEAFGSIPVSVILLLVILFTRATKCVHMCQDPPSKLQDQSIWGIIPSTAIVILKCFISVYQMQPVRK